jgi:hypothetical protein
MDALRKEYLAPDGGFDWRAYGRDTSAFHIGVPQSRHMCVSEKAWGQMQPRPWLVLWRSYSELSRPHGCFCLPFPFRILPCRLGPMDVEKVRKEAKPRTKQPQRSGIEPGPKVTLEDQGDVDARNDCTTTHTQRLVHFPQLVCAARRVPAPMRE